MRIVIDCENFAAQFREPARDNQRTGPVTAIDGDFQATALDRFNIKSSLERFNVVFDRVLMLDGGLDLFPRRLGKLSLMVNVQKLVGLLRIQIEAVAAYKLQGIPLRRIVTGRNGDTSIRFEPGHRQLETGSGTNVEIDDLTTGREQSGYHC